MKKGRLLKALASIKLAVVIILSLATIIAWGTIVEARYDSAAAYKMVYQSVWMYLVMGMLATSLTAVMIDRWPWQKKHTGFVLAHIGIIVLMIGSVITHIWGVDGSITMVPNEAAKNVITQATDFAVYASLDGSSYRKMFDREVDFFLHPPTPDKPLLIDIPGGAIKVSDYYPYAFRDEKIVESKEAKAGAAVRFQLQNPRVNFTDWLLQPAEGREVTKDLGPARVVLTSGEYKDFEGKNVLVLRPKKDDALEYEIHTARTPNDVRKGVVHPGDTVETGWMGIVLRVLKFMPKAENLVSFQKTDRPTELTTAAVKVDFENKQQWMALNSMLKLFTDQAVYIVTYSNRRLDIGFEMFLKEFKIGRYQGTMRAASYESVVNVPGLGERTISMNEPLKYNGYTFYQASFEEDPQTGKPVASILSVNFDPGRWIKYLGSLLIVAGTIHLFYFKRKAARAAAVREVNAA